MQSVPLVTAELLHARPDAIALSPEIPEPSARSFSGKWASLLKLLVEKGKATDHGAALVPWAGSTFARHNPSRAHGGDQHELAAAVRTSPRNATSLPVQTAGSSDVRQNR